MDGEELLLYNCSPHVRHWDKIHYLYRARNISTNGRNRKRGEQNPSRKLKKKFGSSVQDNTAEMVQMLRQTGKDSQHHPVQPPLKCMSYSPQRTSHPNSHIRTPPSSDSRYNSFHIHLMRPCRYTILESASIYLFFPPCYSTTGQAEVK